MRRFGLALDDNLHAEFYRLFPDHGVRTALLRQCVRRIIKQAKATANTPLNYDQIVDRIVEERRLEEDGDSS